MQELKACLYVFAIPSSAPRLPKNRVFILTHKKIRSRFNDVFHNVLLRSLLFFDDSDHNSRNQEDCQGPEVDCNLEEAFCDDLYFVECVHMNYY